MKNFNISGFFQSKKNNMMRVILGSSIILALILPVSAAVSISFTNPTPDDNAILDKNYAYINTTITDAATALINWDNSLVGWWRMNEAPGGTSVEDFSGYGNHGTWYGNTTSNVTTGKFGNALLFDGKNDYVNVSHASSLNITGNMTMEAWVNHTSSDNDYVLGKRNINPIRGYNIIIYSNNLKLVDSNGVDKDLGLAISQNTLHHIAVVINSSGTKATGYVDGIAGPTVTIPPYVNNAEDLYIGFRVGGISTQYFNGTIDEVRIWKRALSPQEIKASYNAGTYSLYNNFTNLANGNYTYQAYAQNPSGEVSQTENRILSIQVLSLESFNNSAHTNIDNFFTAGESTVYMFGTGFTPSQSYKVAFYDGGDNITKDVTNNADSSGNLNASYDFKPGSDEPGTWHAQVIYATGSASGTYSYNGPGVLIEDSFEVDASAIPEFPAGVAIPLAASLIIFVYLRNRVNNGKK